MSWKTVPICDEHWNEEEPNRVPVRMRTPPEPCYRCGRLGDIYVRREISDEGRLTQDQDGYPGGSAT